MSFSREDLVAYSKQPAVDNPNHDPWNPSSTVETVPASPQGEKAELDVNAAIDASITEPTEKGTNDGSTTENTEETVASEVANPEGAKDPDELEDPVDGGRRSRAQERIEELVAERNALRKYGEYLLKQVEGSRNPTEKSEPASQAKAPPAADEPAPTLEDAAFDPVKLSKLQNEWMQKRVDKGIQEAVAQLETRQSEVAARQAFEGRVVEFRKNAPDFEVVIGNPALPQLAPQAARMVVKVSDGPAILYHLGKNPDLAARIARMDTSDQLAAIGRLQERLAQVTQKEPSKEVTPPVKQANVTKAPPPPKPVTGSSNPGKDPGTPMSMDEWVANERNRKIQEKTERQKVRKAFR